MDDPNIATQGASPRPEIVGRDRVTTARAETSCLGDARRGHAAFAADGQRQRSLTVRKSLRDAAAI